MSALLYAASLLIFLMGLVSEQITMLMYRDDEGECLRVSYEEDAQCLI